MKFLFAVVAVLAVAAFAEFDLSDEAVKSAFESFRATHGKNYAGREAETRFSVFKMNLERVNFLNSLKTGAEYGITPFSDLDVEEFQEMYLRSKIQVPANAPVATTTMKDAPASFDWRDKNAVTPVKNQGSCGSCWAFSAVESVESMWFLAGHALPILSPQQLVDCDRDQDQGCNGGLPWNAYEYLIQVGGLESETSYPYIGIDDTCKFSKDKVAATISNWTMVPEDEEVIKNYLYQNGPLSVALNANWLQFYVGGISDPLFCNPKDLDHAVFLVGYGNGKDWLGIDMDYWLVKNSWGETWGEKGYFRLRRGKGVCGINTAVSSALI